MLFPPRWRKWDFFVKFKLVSFVKILKDLLAITSNFLGEVKEKDKKREKKERKSKNENKKKLAEKEKEKDEKKSERNRKRNKEVKKSK